MMMLENEPAENKNEVKTTLQPVDSQPTEKNQPEETLPPPPESENPLNENPETSLAAIETTVPEIDKNPLSEANTENPDAPLAQTQEPLPENQLSEEVPPLQEPPPASVSEDAKTNEITLAPVSQIPEVEAKIPEAETTLPEPTPIALTEETEPEILTPPAIEMKPVAEHENQTALTAVSEVSNEEKNLILQAEPPVTAVEKTIPTAAEPPVEIPDYAVFDKAALLAEVEKLLKEPDIKKADPYLKPLKTAFDELKEKEKNAALETFTAEGSPKDDFEFKPDAETLDFERLYRQLRERKNKHAQEQEKTKEQNYKRKQELLEQMRLLVEDEEGKDSFNAFKKIQQEWKSIGVLPAGAAKELWSSYEILTERYFANRTIFNELKDLDRKRNLTQKIEICEKAEKIAENEVISGQMMKELNDLHDEYKNIGPVPKEAQEDIWQRFKLASDKIYDKRRQQQEVVKAEWEENYKKKIQIIEEAEQYVNFTTDKIGEWNEKTQIVLSLQKQWDTSGNISREQAKDINKRFWAAFKQFFNNKGEFFRKLEEFREQNLAEKTRLCEEAEALKDSEELERTTERMKYLQQRWKEIGPVPEKMRDKIYERFKAACDFFFDRKRGKGREEDDNYGANLKKKLEIIVQLEQMAADKTGDLKTLKELQNEYGSVGFVPKKEMQSIRKRFADAVESFLENMPASSGTAKPDKKVVKLEMEIENAHNDPQALRNLDKQEGFLRKKLTQLENDVALWQNNMEFFARSKNADSVRKEFNIKIEEAEKEIKTIKQQLKLLQNT